MRIRGVAGTAGVLACLLAGAGRASAAGCEASYLADGHKATRWFDLGEVAGEQKKKDCVVKAKNDLANRRLADLGLPKSACSKVPIKVSIFTRVDSKEKPKVPDAVVKASFPADCPAAAPKPKSEKDP